MQVRLANAAERALLQGLLAQVSSGLLSGADSAESPIVAIDDETLLGGIDFVSGSSEMVMLTPPGLTAPPNVRVAEQLLAAVARIADAGAAVFSQCLVHPDDSRSAMRLQRGGFGCVATIDQMQRELVAPVPESHSQQWPRRVRANNQLERAARLLSRTWIDSLDCPELIGLQSPEGILGTYHAPGEHWRWWIYQVDEQDAGLLIARAGQEFGEIACLGVAPEFRGLGLGRFMTIDALHELAEAGSSLVELNVDSNNRPAIRIYESLGFQTTHSMWLFVRLHPEQKAGFRC